jgi:hypothetical protein
VFQDDREVAFAAAKSNSEALGNMSGDRLEQGIPYGNPFGGGMNANNNPPPQKI